MATSAKRNERKTVREDAHITRMENVKTAASVFVMTMDCVAAQIWNLIWDAFLGPLLTQTFQLLMKYFLSNWFMDPSVFEDEQQVLVLWTFAVWRLRIQSISNRSLRKAACAPVAF